MSNRFVDVIHIYNRNVLFVSTAMKRRAAEVAAIKLCKSFVDSKPLTARSRESRSSSADKTQERKDQSLSGDKTQNKKDKTQERKDAVVTDGRQTTKRKSGGSEDSLDSNRRSSLRSRHPESPPDNRSVTKKPNCVKKNDSFSRHSESSSETDIDDSGTVDTEDKLPVKQRRIGMVTVIIRFCSIAGMCCLTSCNDRSFLFQQSI